MAEGGSLNIELGWPAKALSPNSREHYMTKWRYGKAAKDTAYWATKAALGAAKYPHDGERIAVVITAYPADKRERDSDNLLASCKAFLDGIALGLGVNDSFFDPRVQWGELCHVAKLVVAIG